jgi:hypothetical protein
LQGDLELAASSIEEAVALAKSVNNNHLLVRALHNLAVVRFEQGRRDESITLYEETASIAEASQPLVES